MVDNTPMRSRTGCQTCRRRKKKCDEAHPICGGCSRNNIPCQWPNESQARLSRRPRRRVCHSGPGIPQGLSGMATVFAVPTRPVMHRILHHFTERFPVWMSISPGPRRTSFLHNVVSTAVGNALTMDCLLALSAADLSKYIVDEPELQMVASSLYGNALAGVRAAIGVPSSSGKADVIVLAVILLCVHETQNFSDTSRLLPHLNAAAFLLQRRIYLTPENVQLRVLLLEAFSYFFTLAAFSHGPSLALTPAAQVFDSIAARNYSSPRHTMLLGPSQRLIATIFRVARLAMEASYKLEGGTASQELVSIEGQLQSRQVEGGGSDDHDSVDETIFEIYRLACLVYVRQLLDRQLSHKTFELHQIVSSVIEHVLSLPDDSPSNGLIAWPLFVVGSYAVAPTHRRTIIARLRFINKSWKTDIFDHTINFLLYAWETNDSTPRTPPPNADGIPLSSAKSAEPATLVTKPTFSITQLSFILA
ncbi:Zn(II)2Cys6 transcription factor [Aspergillus stella-maris]|uniref:Zn(II)2Cys6 transcription factor n=1 Tax=Aspergillus stella-maris TaxID=1810926 RepID=UPI003CCD1239